MAGQVLKMALDGSGIQTDPLALMMEEYKRLNEEKDAPMFTSDQKRQRIRDNNQQVQLGLLGQMSSDRAIGATGGQVLKRALGDRDERVTNRGTFDPLTGETAMSPEYQQERREGQRQRVLQAALSAQTAREGQQQRAFDAQENRALRATIAQANQGQRGHNLQVVTDPKTGEMFWADPRNPTAPPIPIRNPGGGTPMVKPDPKTELPTSLANKLLENRAAIGQIGVAREVVKNNPGAFGAHNYLGDTITQRIPGKANSGGVSARAVVANIGSKVIHDRSGAAVTISEFPRLRPFIPQVTDTPQAIDDKLAKLEIGYNEIIQQIEAGYPLSKLVQGAQQQPQPQPQPQPSQPGTGVSRAGAVGAQPGAGAAPPQAPPGIPGLPSQDAIAAELARRAQGGQ